jgi:hypothetical protein
MLLTLFQPYNTYNTYDASRPLERHPGWQDLPHHPEHQPPPRLLMPDDHKQHQQQNVPIINIPLGDKDMMDGPQLCIIRATPIGGGDAVGRTNVPFQNTLSSPNIHGKIT